MKRKLKKICFTSLLGLCVGAGVLMFSGKECFAFETGWKYESNVWKYYKTDKSPHLGWLSLGADWYYLEAKSGSMKTGWIKYSDGRWYFLNTNQANNLGLMLKGWQWIDGYCYYFDTVSGRMFESETTPDGYKVDASGHCLDAGGKALFKKGKGILTKKEGSILKTLVRQSGLGGGSGSSGGSGKSGFSRGGSSGGSGASTSIDSSNTGKNENTLENDRNKANDSVNIGSVRDNNDVNDNSNVSDSTGENGNLGSDTSSGSDKNVGGASNTGSSENGSGSKEKNKVPEKEPENSEKPENPEKPVPKEPEKRQEEASDEQKAQKIYEELTKGVNDNVAQFEAEDGKIHTILWVQGINAPKMGENGDFKKEVLVQGNETYVDYIAPYSPGNSWFDVNKSDIGSEDNERDKNLCFAAVASNMLHWWMEQNKEYIEEYEKRNVDLTRKVGTKDYALEDFKNSFISQKESGLFEFFKYIYGNNEKGFYSDLLIDFFINGYTPKEKGGTNIEEDGLQPDKRAGFFYEVFKGKILTERTDRSGYKDFGDSLKEILGEGSIVGVSHTVLGRGRHVVTLWGAEYDLNGNIVAVYITDSDDRGDEEIGMKRYGVKNSNGKAKLSTNVSNKNHGSSVGNIYIFSQGTEAWKEYLK